MKGVPIPPPDSPEVRAVPGLSLDLSSIAEGADVYFDCDVRAQPPTEEINWMFQVSYLYQLINKK